MSFTKREEGFTLWELLLVLTLMGAILNTITSHLVTATEPLKQKVDQANILLIEGAAQVYHLDVGTFPSSVDALIEPPVDLSGWRGPYLKEWPINPWDPLQPYVIDSSGHAKTD